MLRDLYGRPVKPGDHIILKNLEVLPFQIIEVNGPIMQVGPDGRTMVPVQTVKIMTEIAVNVIGDNGAFLNCFRAAAKEEIEDKQKKLVSL